MKEVSCLEGHRYIAWPRRSVADYAWRRMEDMDEFLLCTGSRAVQKVSDADANPFLLGVAAEAAQCAVKGGLAVHRHHLTSLPVGLFPGCEENPYEPDSAEQTSYRARALQDFFAGTVTEEDFVGPVFGELGAAIDIDVKSLVTAKSSGFMIKSSGHGTFVRPWGGHRTVYSEATRLGVLEGIERIGAESPGANMLSAVPEGVRIFAPEDFGISPEDWLVPDPQVGAWSLGQSLITGEDVALPTRLVYYYPKGLEESRWVQESSNGCAIGGSDNEALLFGLLEAIERDAFLAAWYAGLPLDEIRPESVTDPDSRAFLNRMSLCGQVVRFFNATIGVDVPTVIAVCTGPNGSSCVGAGSHPDVEKALHSALIEVASDFQVVAQHLREREAELAAMVQDYSRVRVMEDHADMFAHPDARPLLAPWLDSDHHVVDIDSLDRSGSGHCVEADLTETVEACKRAGLEPIAVSTQTALADAVGARCWKVVVPGLIPIDFGFDYQRALKMPRLARIAEEFAISRGHEPDFTAHTVPHPFP